MMSERIKKICIQKSVSIIAAIKLMDQIHHKLLIVKEGDKFFSLVSIGDIQRAIIMGVSMNSTIENILRENVKVASIFDDKVSLENKVKERKMEFLPIVDDDKNIADVIFWEDLFDTKPQKRISNLNLPVIIMAGGKGTRLKPLTNVLPKPLIPIGEQTIMEDIMDRFVDCGCNVFYVSVNHKADVIKRYFDNLEGKFYNISYIQEDKPLGTAGSLHLLEGKINNTFFVTNCDIIIDEDYAEILKYHRENHNEITAVGAIKSLSVPYGTFETKEDGLLFSIEEKPTYTFKINTGMYILEPHLIKEIPTNEFYHITSLIEKLMKEVRRVGVYPINEGSWTDIGNWGEYLKYINRDE